MAKFSREQASQVILAELVKAGIHVVVARGAAFIGADEYERTQNIADAIVTAKKHAKTQKRVKGKPDLAKGRR